MATNTTTTPHGEHEARYAHTAVSFGFRALLRAAERAIAAEQSLVEADTMLFDPALSVYMTEADDAWTALEDAVEAVLRAECRRTADVALRKVAAIWRAGLVAEDPVTFHFLGLCCQQNRSLFRVPGQDPAARAVTTLLEEAERNLGAFFALAPVMILRIETDDDPEPDPFPFRMPAA